MGEVDLTVDLGKLVLSNPVVAASGTFGYGLEYTEFLDLNDLGGFSTKGLSLKPKSGNPVPRVIETASGMLNAIGLENIGLDAFLSEKLPLLKMYKTRIIVNFFGENNVYMAHGKEAFNLVSNLLVLSPKVIVSDKRFSKINTWLERNDFLVEKISYKNVSKMSGLFRCSTLPLLRE